MTPEPIARVRINLQEIEPEIWRRVEVPLSLSLKGLHEVIQAAFGWGDCHLYAFHIGAKRYGIPDPPWPYVHEKGMLRAKSVRLGAIVGRGIDRFDYVYDFGDEWRHTVVVESTAVGEPDIDYPHFVAGARRGPPEDVGGPFGFFDFLQAVADPHHPRHHSVIERHGGPYDPDDIDLPGIQADLARLAKRRRDGRLGYAKSQALGLKPLRGR
jgi:hypothetical protein